MNFSCQAEVFQFSHHRQYCSLAAIYYDHAIIRKNRATLFHYLHQLIEESANTSTNHIFHGRVKQLINYPPNGGLTDTELKAIEELKGNETLMLALRKLFACNTSDVFFDFLM